MVGEAQPFLVAGEWRRSDRVLEARNPADGAVLESVCQAGPGDVEEAIDHAASAFEEARLDSTADRVELLERVLQGLEAHREPLARVVMQEVGKPIKLARVEVGRTIATFREACEEAKRLRGEWLPLDLDHASTGRQAIVRRFPVGPVAAITPFNFPLNLVAHKVAPALACGNPVLLKPAPQAALSALRFARILDAAGLPTGTLSVLPCPVETARPLVADSRIKLLSFTGSAAVGWQLKALAGRKRVVLELGGNAAVAVHEDANLDYAAQRCAVGGFAYAGQICISVQRIYVHRPVFPAFCERFLAAVAKLHLGNPADETVDVGPMISVREAERAEAWVREALEQGAQLLAGGGRDGAFFQPTVLAHAPPHLRVCREEVFAPVVVLETYEDWNEALGRINDSPYGLQCGLFTRDLQRAFAAYEAAEVGGVLWNDVPTYRSDVMPYGGVKDSGLGREGVRYALEEMTERKVLVLNLHGG